MDASPEADRWLTFTGVLMIASMAILMRSYIEVKLILVAAFLLVFAIKVATGSIRIAVHSRLVCFYLCIAVIGTAWTFVGLLHATNYIQGCVEAFRLYVVWSGAFLVLYTLLRSKPSLHIIHKSMVLGGILIPAINLLGLYDQFGGLNLIPDSVRHELGMEIGFGNGYVQYDSANILILFLIVPYLLSLQFRTDAGESNSFTTKLALVLSLILVVLSGRRALWLVVAFTPFTILVLSRAANISKRLKPKGRRLLISWTLASMIGFSVLLFLPQSAVEMASLSRIKEAFSSQDERTIQKPYLISGFMSSPVFGSGFGASVSYQRSDERPWMYELTYYQMLFNLGVFGMTTLGLLFSFYFVKTTRLLRQFKHGSVIPFGLMVAYVSFFIGAYGDPYFGGFDSLFFVGLLPYLSTFQYGFANSIGEQNDKRE